MGKAVKHCRFTAAGAFVAQGDTLRAEKNEQGDGKVTIAEPKIPSIWKENSFANGVQTFFISINRWGE